MESQIQAPGFAAQKKTLFEKTLYEEYGVVPDHYEYIGNDVYQVYVKIDDKIVPYVAVNWKTGDFHG